MNDPIDPGHPIGPESDDSANPTAAAPDEWTATDESASMRPRDELSENEPVSPPPGPTSDEPAQQRTGREMLSQLQSMIDTLAVQAAPVMRDIAAKAAELAAVAGEKA